VKGERSTILQWPNSPNSLSMTQVERYHIYMKRDYAFAPVRPMTITIELPPHVEAGLAAMAARWTTQDEVRGFGLGRSM
jgi:hypothetical protein